MKKIGKLLRIGGMAAVLAAFLCVSAGAFSTSDVEGSWYGQYTGYYDPTSGPTVNVERYIDLTIDTCDSSGAFSGSAKVTTVEGQGYDSQWFNYDFEGTVKIWIQALFILRETALLAEARVQHGPPFPLTVRCASGRPAT